MGNGTSKCVWFFLGAVVGVSACVLMKNGAARKAAVALAGKGLELKERVAATLERGKESVEDFVAEAKASAESDKA